MSIIINPPELTPQRKYPRAYGAVSLWGGSTIDTHAFINATAGGGVVFEPPTCTLLASPYNWTCEDISLKPDGQRAVRDVVEAEPRWFTVAVEASTRSCVDLEAIARTSAQANVELALEGEIATALQLAAPAPIAEPSLPCALGAAAASIAATLGDGVGLITISPSAYLQVNLHNPGYFTDVDGRLYDGLGNVYHVNPTVPANTIYAETESRTAVFLSDVELLSELVAQDAQRDTNTLIVRATAGYILISSRCNVSGWSYTCI